MNSLETREMVLDYIGKGIGVVGMAGVCAYYNNKCSYFNEIIHETGKILTSHTKLHAEKSYEQLNCAETVENSFACLIVATVCLFAVVILVAQRRQIRREENRELRG